MKEFGGKMTDINFSIINIDKPAGPTSFTVSDYVRQLLEPLGVTKTSHFGTLDPQVTGVLPIALNRACRLSGYFLNQDKEYVGIMHVHKPVSREEIEEVIKLKFLGKIMQKPPVKSRVKRVLREREIKRFEILEQDERDFLFLAEVQAGTYIRKLIDDLGKEIGGAHMLELRRTRACIFPESESITLYELEKIVKENKLDEKLIPAEEAVTKIMKVVQIRKANLDKILHGKPIHKEDLARKYKIDEPETVAIFLDKRFIETAKVVNEATIFAKPEFVLN